MRRFQETSNGKLILADGGNWVIDPLFHWFIYSLVHWISAAAHWQSRQM